MGRNSLANQKLSAAFLVLLLVFTVVDVRGSDAYVILSGEFVKIGNRFIELVITFGNNTGGGIYGIIDKSTGVDFIKRKDAVGIGLFALDYWSEDRGWYHAMLGRNAKNITYVSKAASDGAWLNITWSGLSSTESDDRCFDVTVSASICVPSSSRRIYWYISIDSEDDKVIENIVFPLMVGVSQIGDEDSGDYLVVPELSGILIKNPSMCRLGTDQTYPSGFQNMQFLAYYATRPSSGFILMSLDSTGRYMKRFSASLDDRGALWFSIVHIPPDFKPSLKYSLPYPVVIEVFNGDWWDAAQIYKSWAVKQWWVSQGTVSERGDLPEWIKKVGVAADVFTRYWERHSIYWNGPFSNVPRIAKAMVDYYETTPLLSWRGWEKHGFGMAPPDYLPPSEGWENFTKNAVATRDNGGRTLVLPLFSSYSFNATGWEEASKHAPMNRHGNLYKSFWQIHNNSGVIVRQASFVIAPGEFMLRTMINVSVPLVSAGVDVIQLDGCPFMPFLNYENSELPKGGGTWWADGYARVFTSIRETLKSINKEVGIASEWFSEPYIPYLDLSNDQVNTGFSSFRPDLLGNQVQVIHIPLWHAVYHEYLILFSTIVHTSKAIFKQDNSKLFYLRGLAIPLIWGEIPMVSMDPQGEGPPYELSIYDQEILEYSKRIVQARSTYAYPYLVEGRMLRPPSIENNAIITIPGAKFIPYTGIDVPPFNWTSVMASSWAAPDGSVGVVLTNIGPRTTIRISLDELITECGHDCVAYFVKNGEFSFPIFIPREKLEIELDQRDVLVLVMTDRSTARGNAAILLNKSHEMLKGFESRGYNVTEHVMLFNEAIRSFLLNDFDDVERLVNQLERGLEDSIDKLVKELREENRRLKEELEALRERLIAYEGLELRYRAQAEMMYPLLIITASLLVTTVYLYRKKS